MGFDHDAHPAPVTRSGYAVAVEGRALIPATGEASC